MILSCDWHLHSCLSPCADLAMSPSAIVSVLQKKNIQIAALTDHNTCLNCPTFAKLCFKANIAALYGMELQTIEEIHTLCLFANLQTAMNFGEEIYNLIPFFKNNPEKNGDQVYVDEDETILGEVEKYLHISAEISLDDATQRVHELGGLCIPAHVNRFSFSIISQLGFIPPGNWDALEVTAIPPTYTLAHKKNKVVPLDTCGYPLTTSSDAHYIENIGQRAFTLDIKNDPLFTKKKEANLDTIRTALSRRPR
ncbi:MAG TPA: PHP domain-containing protein [Treponemataceae bacterium]|nr:PHP domain-containing protein [Treponemataceae bacterium]